MSTPMSREEQCLFKDCKHDHYDNSWLDEILFLKLGLDLTRKDIQHPVVGMKDLHEARADIIAHIDQTLKAFADEVEKELGIDVESFGAIDSARVKKVIKDLKEKWGIEEAQS